MKTSLWWIPGAALIAALTAAASSPPNLDKALAAQRQIVAQEPYDARAHNDLGNLLALAGEDVEAERAYRRAIELDTAQTAARFNLAVLLQQLGDWRSAKQELTQILDLEPGHAWAHYQLGILFADRGRRDNALEHYARAFALDPTLTFAYKNPHVIDNQLLTEAMLLSQRYDQPTGSRVPRLYGEPDRIAQLMLDLDPDAPPAAASPPPAESEPANAASTSRSTSSTPVTKDEDEGDEDDEDEWDEDDEEGRPDGSDRALTQGDLDPDSSVGQVQGGAAVGSRTAPGRPIIGGRGSSSRTIRTRPADPRQRATPAPRAGSGTSSDRRSGGARYIPGRSSTSRLELRLLDESTPVETLAAR